MGSKTPKMISGAIYGLLSWIGPLVVSLLVTPEIVFGLGLEHYGIYSLVMGFVAFSANVNIARALTRYIAECRGTGRESEIPSLISSTLVVIVCIGAVSSVCVIAGAGAFTEVLIGGSGHRDDTVTALTVGAAIIFTLFINQALLGVLQGFQELRWFSIASVINGSGTLLINLVLVRLEYGLVGVLLGTLVAAVIGATLTAVAAHRLSESALLGRVRPTDILKILSYSKWVVGYQMLGYSVLLFERVAIAGLYGPQALSFYVIPLLIGIQFHGMISSLSLFIFPMMSTASHSHGMLLSLYQSASKLVLALSGLTFLMVLLHGEQFLSLWMGNEFAEEATPLFTLQMVGFCAMALSVVAFQTVEGAGKPRINFIITCVVSLVSFVVMATPWLGSGPERFALARAIGFSLWLPGLAVIERVVFGSFQSPTWIPAIGRVAFAGAILFGVHKVVGLSPISGWSGLTVSVILEASLAGACLWGFRYFDSIVAFLREARESND